MQNSILQAPVMVSNELQKDDVYSEQHSATVGVSAHRNVDYKRALKAFFYK